MKVLHVIPSIGTLRGGPSFVMRTLAEGLADRGLVVHVATTDDNGGTARMNVPLGVPIAENKVVYRYFPRQTSFYTFSLPLTKWLWKNSHDYDLVHIHALFSYSSTAAALIARRRGIPYIIRPLGILNRWGIENRRPLLKSLSFRLFERNILERAAAVQYTSEQEQHEAEQLGFHAPGAIIPNPVDVKRSEPLSQGRFRERYPSLRGKVVFLFMSRVDPKKGLDLLIPAFAKVHKTLPDTALVIAGNGPAELVSSLQELAKKHQVESDITWSGFLQGQDKWDALSDADVFVLASYSENFGVAAVEAMGCGLPLIVSDQVGIHSQIRQHEAGLVTSCDATSIADALTRMANSPDLRQTMGKRGLQLAQSSFSPAAVCQSMAGLYDAVTTH